MKSPKIQLCDPNLTMLTYLGVLTSDDMMTSKERHECIFKATGEKSNTNIDSLVESIQSIQINNL